MCKVLMLADNGFEEIEAISVIDILRRAKIQCDFCSVINSEYLTGSHNISVKSDVKLQDMGTADEIACIYDAVTLPGGMPGSDNLRDNEVVIEILKAFDKSGKIVSAICAAPKTLERAGLLIGKRVTFYPESLGKSLEIKNNLIYTGDRIETDRNVITGKAPGAAADFAFELIRVLKGNTISDKVKAAMFY